jgi:hypothetical protein
VVDQASRLIVARKKKVDCFCIANAAAPLEDAAVWIMCDDPFRIAWDLQCP